MKEHNHSQLNIAILVRQFPNIVQTYVLNHILALKKAGFNTLIIAEYNPEQPETHPSVMENKLLEETIYIKKSLPGLIKHLVSLPYSSSRFWLAVLCILKSNLWRQRGIIYTLKCLIRVNIISLREIDIIHSHSLFSSYDYLFLKNVFSIPIITTFHGLVPRNVKMLAPEKIRAVLDDGDVFFVNTVFAKNQMIALGCLETKIHVIPQCTNTADFPYRQRSIPNNRRIVILSVGRLSIEKGFNVAIEAVSEIIEHFPDIEYQIIGGGPEEQTLKSLIRSHRLDNNVIINGTVSTEELRAHFSDAHIFILPSIDLHDGSHTETQGVVLQEAQSSGIPIIACKTGGIPEVIIDGETGLLCPENDSHALAQNIDLLITDKILYKKLQENAHRDVVENYSPDPICLKQRNIYMDLATRTK